MKPLTKSPILLFAIIGLAVLLVVFLVKSKSPVQHTADAMPRKTVETISIKPIPYRTKVTGYGNVVPAITVNSMAEVSGKVSYVHPKLKAGETIPAGTVVVRINPKDYAVILTQTEADLAANQSQFRELEEEEKTTRRSLALAKENLKVGEQEYQRIKGVYEKKVVAKSTLDAEEQQVIALRQSVEELQGKINGFESRRQTIEAQIIRAEREVDNSKTKLGRTEISLPFDARIGTVNIEKDEFVSVGSPLFEAIDLQGVEITAQLPMSTMRRLVSNLKNDRQVKAELVRVGGRIAEQLNLSAKVRLVNDNPEANWEASVLRISDSIDTTRQTVGVVVGVEKPYEKAIPGVRPPLIKGMYTAVELYSQPKDSIIIPRQSVHQDRVYIANDDNILEIRPIRVLHTQGDLAVIASGLNEGDKVIVTDLFPVIEGMPLSISDATTLSEKLKQQANGDI